MAVFTMFDSWIWTRVVYHALVPEHSAVLYPFPIPNAFKTVRAPDNLKRGRTSDRDFGLVYEISRGR